MGGRRRLACRLLAAVRPHVRLAELVAGLSLGIDLGFGQPMEHVLRQCLIALRLADGLGLDEQQRAVVYYTALLLNVGCHSDAHEQAKWFGDDIASKAIKYDLKSRRMAAAGMRFQQQHPASYALDHSLSQVSEAPRVVSQRRVAGDEWSAA